MPQVSVILPTYNRAYCIQRTIDSVLNQTFSNFELLIVDDASTDNTVNLINALADPRIRLLELSQNIGKSAAVNLAAQAATGSWQQSAGSWPESSHSCLKVHTASLKIHIAAGTCPERC